MGKLDPDLALKAAAHRQEMQDRYGSEIHLTALRSKIFSDFVDVPERTACSEQSLAACDSLSAADRFGEGKTAILNFADYGQAGGRFLDGSHAQEECLCHESTLFNILDSPELSGYYKWNRAHKNKGLYENRAIYSPQVRFSCGKYFDVLTCAAPYAWAARRNGVSQEQIDAVMADRIHFIHNILEHEMVDTAILGAYGCGVFRNTPETAARLFKKEFAASGIRNVIYAIPGGKNLTVFQQVFQ